MQLAEEIGMNDSNFAGLRPGLSENKGNRKKESDPTLQTLLYTLLKPSFSSINFHGIKHIYVNLFVQTLRGLWCRPPIGRYFCTPEITSQKKGIFLIPLTKRFLFTIGTKLLEG